MSIEYLVTTVNCENPLQLIKEMNIKSNVRVGNQSNFNQVDILSLHNQTVSVYNFNERGVGLNRNNLLMRSNKDYLVFADDDMIFKEDADSTIKRMIKEYPNVDVFLFNLDENESQGVKRFVTRKPFFVKGPQVNRFGAARMVVRRKSIHKHGIFFNLGFGGGTDRSHGEDTIFLNDCIKNGLAVLALPESIAKLTEKRESTWFSGYNEKYLIDKGYLYTKLYGKKSIFFILQNSIRHRKLYKERFSIKESIKFMKIGKQQFMKHE